MQNKALITGCHILGCLLFLSIPVILAPTHSFSALKYFHRTKEEFMVFSLLIIFFYFNYYFLLPKLYFAQKHNLYYAKVLLSFIIVDMVPRLILGVHHHPHDTHLIPHKHFQPHKHFVDLFELSYHLFLFISIVFISLSVYIHTEWKKTIQQKTNAELLYLKAQLNPHFLFNTLNGIYSLALQKSDDTAPAIVKLSSLMRYVITEAQQEFVTLNQELDYIVNYVELQKIRIGNTATIQFEIVNDNSGKLIAPLMLIPFIENAFKYGVNPEELSEIKIAIEIKDAILNLHVKNKKTKSVAESTQTGIDNTTKRLQHSYPGRHQLIINNTALEYEVTLKLQI